ncbi:MAG: hypothetical protein ACC634_08005, partial [Hyphomicrobiales bacterium]
APGRPLVQFFYGPFPPVPSRPKRFVADHLDTVLRNLPPARIWTYRRPAGFACAPGSSSDPTSP